MKDATWKHKGHFQKKLRPTQDYSLTYCTSPDKAYVIEPHDGEINYDEAYKKPNQFIQKVMNQDVTQHKVRTSKEVIQRNAELAEEARANNDPSPRSKKVPLTIYSKLTKRKVGLIWIAVSGAIFRFVKKETGLTDAEVEEALKAYDVKVVVNKHLKEENIQLVDRENRPVYRRQISSFGTGHDLDEDEDEHPDLDPADAKIVSVPLLFNFCFILIENAARHA